MEYLTETENTLHAYETGLKKTKPVLQYDLDGTFIKEFKSASEAAKQLNKKINSAISTACKDPTFTKTSGGFKWRFKELQE